MSQRSSVCLASLVVSLSLAAVCAVLSPPETALAKKPRGGGGGKDGGNQPVCVTFPVPWSSTGVESDGLGDYCNDKKGKVEAVINTNGGLELSTNTAGHRDPLAGRTFFVDFGRPIDLIGYPATIQETYALPNGFVNKSEVFKLSAHDGVDLRAMAIGELRTDANLSITVKFNYPDGETGGVLSLFFFPGLVDFGCSGLGVGNTHVTVERIDATTWKIYNFTVDENDTLIPSKATLHERLTTTGGGHIGDWCRTDTIEDGGLGEDLVELPPFEVTVTLP